MGNFLEIESAARRLSAEERRRLLLSLAASLREEGRPLPAPRSFTSAEMQAWIKEDERDLAAYRSGIALILLDPGLHFRGREAARRRQRAPLLAQTGRKGQQQPPPLLGTEAPRRRLDFQEIAHGCKATPLKRL